MKERITNNYQETQKLGQNFAQRIFKSAKKRKGAVVVAMEGELGSGKTTFAQGMAKGLEIKENITSPTFVLIKKYPIKFQVSSFKFQSFYHIDCYRLEKPWQLQELGFNEIINNPKNIVAIEWAERVAEIFPQDAIRMKFEWLDGEKRRIVFIG